MSTAEAAAQKFLTESSISSIPVPVEALVRRLGAQLSQHRMPRDVSGMLLRDKQRTLIAVNAYHANTRQRFTIAHELGHLILHRGVFVDTLRVNLRDGQASQGTDYEEVQANAFAAELLMPRYQVLQAATTLVRDGPVAEALLVQRLARQFDVSPQAMGIRLVGLGLSLPS